MRRGSFVIIGGAVLLFAAALFMAQDFQLRTGVTVVDVPVSVRDESGALVGSLKQDDFTILEDGKPQMISNFSTEQQPLSAAIVIDTAMNGEQIRRFSLVSGVLMKEFKAIDEFAAYRYDHVVTKLSDFTSNPENLEKSFDAVRQIGETKPADSEPAVTVGPGPLKWILDRTQIGSNGAPSTATRPNPSAPTPSTGGKGDQVSRVLHDAIYNAAADLEKRPKNRRKIIILVSNGQVTGENEHPQSETAARLFRDGIQLFAVDPEHKIFDHLTLLNSYTRGTGGAVFDGNAEQSMARAFGQIVEQVRDEYLLGYISSNEITGTRPKLRTIDVKVRDKKLKVTHRQNYMQYPG